MPKKKSIPIRHDNPREHVYCPACRVAYNSNNPGRGVMAITRQGGRRSFRGGVPTLRYLAARAVGRRDLFRYQRPRHIR